MSMSATYRKIAKVDFKIPDTVSKEAADLIRRVRRAICPGPSARQTEHRGQLLRHDAEARLSLDKVAVHPWVLRYQKKTSSVAVGGGTSAFAASRGSSMYEGSRS